MRREKGEGGRGRREQEGGGRQVEGREEFLVGPPFSLRVQAEQTAEPVPVPFGSAHGNQRRDRVESLR